MKMGNNIWINTNEDFAELKSMFDGGSRLASPLEFSHTIENDGIKFCCFRPTDRRVDGVFYITPAMICDVFTMLDATVTYKHDETPITFDGRSMIINHRDTIKYEHVDYLCYQFCDGLFQSENAYRVLEMLAGGGFFNRMTLRGMHEAGYIKQQIGE